MMFFWRYFQRLTCVKSVIFTFDSSKQLEVASKEHNYNDVVIIINDHYINRNYLEECSTRMREDGLILRGAIFSPAICLSAVGIAALKGNFAMFGFVYYGEDCTPSTLSRYQFTCLVLQRYMPQSCMSQYDIQRGTPKWRYNHVAKVFATYRGKSWTLTTLYDAKCFQILAWV